MYNIEKWIGGFVMNLIFYDGDSELVISSLYNQIAIELPPLHLLSEENCDDQIRRKNLIEFQNVIIEVLLKFPRLEIKLMNMYPNKNIHEIIDIVTIGFVDSLKHKKIMNCIDVTTDKRSICYNMKIK